MRAKKEAVAVLTALCDEEIERTVALWNRVLTSDKLTEARLRAQLLEDENYDPQLFLLAREGEKIIGFAAGIRRRVPYYERGLQPDTGWLLAFGVAPEAQRHGVGSALLAELGQRFAAAGVRRLVVGMYSPGYFMPGVDCAHYPAARPFLAAHGCRFGAQHTAMCRTLFDYAIPESVQKKTGRRRGRRLSLCAVCRRTGGDPVQFCAGKFHGGLAEQRQRADPPRRRRAADLAVFCAGR